MVKILILSALFQLLGVYAHARGVVMDGGDVGNGGDVVECPGGHPFKHKLLDFYEAGVLNSTFIMDLGGPTISVENKVQMYLDRLTKVSPIRALNYKTTFDSFFNNVLWLQGQELQDIQDSAHLVLPVQCKIRQLAIRLPEQRVPGKKFLINQDIWDQLDNDQKAGLVMHEIIYEEAAQNGHRNSIKSRKLNAWIASQEFANVAKEEFSSSMVKMNFPTYEMLPGYDRLYLSSVSYHSEGWIHTGYVSHPSWLPFVGGQWIEISAGSVVKFFKSGFIESVHNSYPEPLLPKGYDLVIRGNRFSSTHTYSGIRLQFYENGMLKELCSKDKTNLDVVTAAGSFKIKFDCVRFNENGTLKYATLLNSTKISSSLSPDPLNLICLGFDPSETLNLGCLTQPARMRYANGFVVVPPIEASRLPEYYDSNPSFRSHSNGMVSEVFTQELITYSQHNQSILLTGRLKFDSSGLVQAGSVAANQYMNLFGVQVPLVEESDFDVYRAVQVEAGQYRFVIPPHDITCITDNSSGSLSIRPNQTLEGCALVQGSSIHLFGQPYTAKSSWNDGIGFFNNGKIHYVYLEDQQLEVLIRGQKYTVLDSIEFHPNGVPRRIQIANESTFTAASGSQITLPQNSIPEFDENGFLIQK